MRYNYLQAISVVSLLFFLPTHAISAEKDKKEAAKRWLDAVVATNMSLMEYAEQNHDHLKTKAISISINPNAGNNMAEWRYTMPD